MRTAPRSGRARRAPPARVAPAARPRRRRAPPALSEPAPGRTSGAAAIQPEVGDAGVAAVLPGGHVDDAYAFYDLFLGPALRAQRDHRDVVTAFDKRLGLTSDPRVRFVLAGDEHSDSRRSPPSLFPSRRQ